MKISGNFYIDRQIIEQTDAKLKETVDIAYNKIPSTRKATLKFCTAFDWELD